jgi:hypothetical protein
MLVLFFQDRNEKSLLERRPVTSDNCTEVTVLHAGIDTNMVLINKAPYNYRYMAESKTIGEARW